MSEKKALVVDDEQDIRTYISGVLTDEGWTVVEATNGEEGLETASVELPDLIMLDIMMPVMNGFETFKALRQDPNLGEVPIIILSSVNDFELGVGHTAESMGEQLGVHPPNAFLEKPIEARHLRETVQRITG